MTNFIKVNVRLLIALLVLQLLPSQVYADDSKTLPELDYPEVALSSADSDVIELFEEETGEILLTTIPNGTIVELIEERQTVSLIRYTQKNPDKEPLEWTGFVDASTIEHPDAVQEASEVPAVEDIEEAEARDVLPKEEVLETDKPLETGEGELPVIVEAEPAEEAAEEAAEEPIEEAIEEPSEDATIQPTEEADPQSDPSTGKIEETIETEEVQAEETNETEEAKVLEAGDEKTIDDTEETNMPKEEELAVLSSQSTADSEILEGIALDAKTYVYKETNKTSARLKTYSQGKLLKFRAYNSEWFSTTVYIDGVAQKGFIHKSSVDLLKEERVVTAYADIDNVLVFKSPTRSAGVWKSYNFGRSLTLRTYSSQWYKAIVIVDGVSRTGYIAASEVSSEKPETPEAPDSGEVLKGVASAGRVSIYSDDARTAGVLKTYSRGRILAYREFNGTWYKTNVYINGSAKTGYIHKSDVETITANPKKVKGIGIKSPTAIYSKASTGAAVLKTYPYGSILAFHTFTSSWYETTVYVNGKAKTGYIHKNDIVFPNGKIVYLDPGHGGKDSGATANGIVEKALVLDIGLRTEKLLKNAGFTVLMTRRTDVFLELAERSSLANASKADAFVSIHANAFNGYAKGIETFWYDKFEAKESERLANELQENLVGQMGLSDRRVAEGNYHVIRETKAPSALVEVGFIDNAYDAAKLKLEEYKKRAAEGIFAGILAFFS